VDGERLELPGLEGGAGIVKERLGEPLDDPQVARRERSARVITDVRYRQRRRGMSHQLG
jgi:hypothetical protein